MRETLRLVDRTGKTRQLQHIQHSLTRSRPRLRIMKSNRFSDLSADRHRRVEGRHRILEHHRQFIPAEATHFRLRKIDEVPAVEENASPHYPSTRRQEPHYRQRRY